MKTSTKRFFSKLTPLILLTLFCVNVVTPNAGAATASKKMSAGKTIATRTFSLSLALPATFDSLSKADPKELTNVEYNDEFGVALLTFSDASSGLIICPLESFCTDEIIEKVFDYISEAIKDGRITDIMDQDGNLASPFKEWMQGDLESAWAIYNRLKNLQNFGNMDDNYESYLKGFVDTYVMNEILANLKGIIAETMNGQLMAGIFSQVAVYAGGYSPVADWALGTNGWSVDRGGYVWYVDGDGYLYQYDKKTGQTKKSKKSNKDNDADGDGKDDDENNDDNSIIWQGDDIPPVVTSFLDVIMSDEFIVFVDQFAFGEILQTELINNLQQNVCGTCGYTYY